MNPAKKVQLLALGLVLILNLAATAASKPNILLIFSDDHAKKALSCYGNTDIQTPGLDRIAVEGMRFEHALTPNSFCTPARAAVLTGKYSHKNGVTHLNQNFDGSQQTFPKLLQAGGYETSLFGKWHLLSQPTGFDHYCVMKMQGQAVDPKVFEPQHEWIPWSPQDRKSFNLGGRKLKGYNNDAITDEALNWLKNREGDKPFCMLLHPKPPHAPYHPPKKYEDFLKDVEIPEPATLLDDYKGRTPEAIADIMTANRIVLMPPFQKLRKQLEKENPDITRNELTRAMYQEYIKGYYRLVKSTDDNVGRVLDYLDESGLAENTLVIYTSDQGFSLGEHGFYNKQWMYEGPMHQPLLVRYPGTVQAGTVHESMVNHVDLAPTLLDFAGLSIPEDLQGYSLKPILEGKAEKVRDASYYHFYSHGKRLPEMIGVRTATHKLIHYPGMEGSYQWELFDLEKDPDEMDNLYGRTEHKATGEGLKAELRKLIRELDDPVEAPKLMTDEAAAGSIRNILLIMSDDLKASALGSYGNTVCKTPNLDRLAETGMVFERAYCQGLACAPSRPSMMRSIYPKSKATAPTIGEHLQKHGLHTARVGKIFHMPVPDAPKNGTSGKDVPTCWTEYHNTKSEETYTPGLYRLMNKGIATRELKGRQGAGTRHRMYTSVEADQEDGSDQADYLVATKAIELLKQRKAEGKPFFLGVGFFRPHYPLVAPKKFFHLYPQETMKIPPLIEGDLDDIPPAGQRVADAGLNDTEEGRRRMWQGYYASVTFMDEQLGRVLDELDRLGLRDSTAILFTSDHGLHLGEHGFWLKQNLHEEVARVPFIVSGPDVKPGRTSSLVELVDFYPTCTDLLGLPAPEGLHGKSLVPILRNPEATVRDTALSIHTGKPAGGIRADTWHYMNYGDKGEELYDMDKDPHQYTNLVDDPAYAALLKEARAKYKQRMAAVQ